MPASAVMERTANAQINARIPAELKSRGDAGLARAGLTPTQAVRALWDLAANNVDKPEVLERTLFPEQVASSDARARSVRERRASAIAKGPSIVRAAYEANGFSWMSAADSHAADKAFDELLDQAYEERYGQMMGWS